MIVSIIVAASENNVIGKNNDLIWSFPNDMNFFKQKTLNHHVIMGRKNFESIPHKFKPLPNRTNIVITRNLSYDAEGAVVVNSLSQAIEFSRKEKQKETFVIGGGQIYDLSLKENLIDRIYHFSSTTFNVTFFTIFSISSTAVSIVVWSLICGIFCNSAILVYCFTVI